MNSEKTFDAALALFEQARVESAAELAQAKVRVAKLQAVAALEKAGEMEKAQQLLAEVVAEQKALE